MFLPPDHRPVRQGVIVGIAVVEEAALLDDQLARMHARSIAAVPAERPLAGGLRDRIDRAADMVALLLAGQQRAVLPAPAVRDDVMAARPHLSRGVAVAVECDGTGVEGAFHLLFVA